MRSKLIQVLGSMRFWMSVLGAIVLLLGQQEVIPMSIATIIAGWLGVGVAVRTFDK